MGKGNGANLRQVADRAGVSVMTASLALRVDIPAGRISEATRERVVRAAEEVHYQPNARARALRLGRSNVLGLYAGHGFVNVRRPFFSEIVSGMQEGCEAVRKDLLLHGTFHTASPDSVLEELLDGRIDGLAVSMPATDPLADRLRMARLAVVAIADAIPGIPSVLVDDASGARQVAEHLAETGRQRVWFVVTDLLPDSAQRRRDGFLEVGSAVGLCGAAITLRQGGEVDLLKLAIAAGVEALACWNDDTAQVLLEAAMRMGIAIPKQMAITGFDGCPTTYSQRRPLTTIAAPWAEVGRRAALALDALLTGCEPPPEQVLPVRLLLGDTT